MAHPNFVSRRLNVETCVRSMQVSIINMFNTYRSGFVRVTQKTKQTLWPLVRERTIPTERPPHIDEI
jgi:hypothetical protein